MAASKSDDAVEKEAASIDQSDVRGAPASHVSPCDGNLCATARSRPERQSAYEGVIRRARSVSGRTRFVSGHVPDARPCREYVCFWQQKQLSATQRVAYVLLPALQLRRAQTDNADRTPPI